MENENMLVQQEPIHGGHLGAIFLVAILLVGITVMRNGFAFHPKTEASEAPAILTYEEAKKQVLAESGQDFDTSSIASGTEEQQMALVDPSRQNGNVAGASTELGFHSAEEIFTPQVLGAVSVNLKTGPTTQASLLAYSDAITALEANTNAIGILEALNSDNKQALSAASQTSRELFAALQQMSVPAGIEEYHKYQMFYYQTLGEMADIFEGSRSESDMQTVSEKLFGLIQKISTMKADVSAQYGVQL